MKRRDYFRRDETEAGQKVGRGGRERKRGREREEATNMEEV